MNMTEKMTGFCMGEYRNGCPGRHIIITTDEQVGQGHVDYKNVYRFSYCLRLVIHMNEFPTSETAKIRLKAMAYPIFSAVGFRELEQLDPFIVVFMFVKIF